MNMLVLESFGSQGQARENLLDLGWSKPGNKTLMRDSAVGQARAPGRQPRQRQARGEEVSKRGTHGEEAPGFALRTNNRMLGWTRQTTRPLVVRVSNRSKRPVGSRLLTCAACCST